MQAKLKYTNIGPRLMVTKPVASPVTAEYLMGLSPRQRLTCVYKRMYKLRFMAGDSQSQQEEFKNLLRRKFQKQDFNIRRNKLLGLDEQLLEQSMARRLANTYAFLFNATCEPDRTIPEVNFYHDLEDALKSRHETSVIHTMLRMEYETPSILKYDYAYRWVEGVKDFYKLADQELLSKDYNKLAGSKIAHFIGFLQYERSVAYLNESLTLCL
ncbi:hypothetical protein METBIDRAFT_13363 [Metschnikowia bicuspidata var. bicuspidata NRRL YB-4993]|uniref:Uncharacterized protein n=1 Tax=Metschnikowia bicuspidata var. bicuspidata NRRL YB-4993 TaxID=869754 RepID=A0A1A0H6F8_9ASCO|nr:hypothetical protein METBIDRAFT_13363 [Metschnikowia bicuspidata var. bicuspidata NRRL YB-4993]OBA19616.1 hypothetical protein METBIDRAFT_13363 [Metschnikowia bicuspidata var. bicuspidata NRRL YB-4993]